MYDYTSKDIIRFWEKVNIEKNSKDCWEWIASCRKDGYGQFHIGGNHGNTIPSHRTAWEMTYGPIPDGLWVLHKCDNRKCCNPSHLYVGTRADNERDKIIRNRIVKGEDSKISKLSYKGVAQIREMYTSGDYTQQEIADIFNVCQSSISRIMSCETWKTE